MPSDVIVVRCLFGNFMLGPWSLLFLLFVAYSARATADGARSCPHAHLAFPSIHPFAPFSHLLSLDNEHSKLKKRRFISPRFVVSVAPVLVCQRNMEDIMTFPQNDTRAPGWTFLQQPLSSNNTTNNNNNINDHILPDDNPNATLLWPPRATNHWNTGKTRKRATVSTTFQFGEQQQQQQQQQMEDGRSLNLSGPQPHERPTAPLHALDGISQPPARKRPCYAHHHDPTTISMDPATTIHPCSGWQSSLSSPSVAATSAPMPIHQSEAPPSHSSKATTTASLSSFWDWWKQPSTNTKAQSSSTTRKPPETSSSNNECCFICRQPLSIESCPNNQDVPSCRRTCPSTAAAAAAAAVPPCQALVPQTNTLDSYFAPRTKTATGPSPPDGKPTARRRPLTAKSTTRGWVQTSLVDPGNVCRHERVPPCHRRGDTNTGPATCQFCHHALCSACTLTCVLCHQPFCTFCCRSRDQVQQIILAHHQAPDDDNNDEGHVCYDCVSQDQDRTALVPALGGGASLLSSSSSQDDSRMSIDD